MNAPLISVLLPVYNCGTLYLTKALQSIFSQSYGNFEVIAINDGSTDGSGDVLDSFAYQDSRLKIYTQSNQGLPITLDTAYKKSRGELIARMDGDDISDPYRLQKQLQFLRENPGVGACGTWSTMIDPFGDTICKMRPPLHHNAIEELLYKGNATALIHPTLMTRREIFELAGGYNPNNELEDLDLYLRLVEVTQLANIPETLLQYRVHFGSTNHQRRQRHVQLTIKTVCDARKRRGLPPGSSLFHLPCRSDRKSEVYQDWAMKAYFDGNLRISRKYALKSFFAVPHSKRSWKAPYLAFLKNGTTQEWHD